MTLQCTKKQQHDYLFLSVLTSDCEASSESDHVSMYCWIQRFWSGCAVGDLAASPPPSPLAATLTAAAPAAAACCHGPSANALPALALSLQVSKQL